MKFYWNENVYGWRLWGIVGKNAAWFIGVSKKPTIGVKLR